MDVNQDKPMSTLEEYLGFSAGKIMIFCGLVLGVVVIVTGIYVAIFGFDNWKSSMQQAGSMMLANFDPVPAPGTGVVITPQVAVPPVAQVAPAAPVAATQFVCPNCGAAGLPNWSLTGAPLCPNCGAVMGVAGSQTSPAARLAFAP